MVVTIAHNAVNAKLVGSSREVKLIVREALSYAVDGAQFSQTFSTTPWDGRSSFFDFTRETFPAGFVYLAWAKLRAAGYEVNLVRKPFPAPLGPEFPVVDSFGYDPKFDYQPAVIKSLVKHGQIIARVATGGGKSRIAKMAHVRIGRNTMFLTTRSILMYQMKMAVEDMGERVSTIGDDHEWPGRFEKFTVAMVQSLAGAVELLTADGEVLRALKNRDAAEDRLVTEFLTRHRKVGTPALQLPDLTTAYRKQLEAARVPDRTLVEKIQRDVIAHNLHRLKVLEYLKTVDLLILEEAHEASGDGYYQIARHCVNAHYRLALTATPFMRESQEANMRLMACSGVVAITVTEEELIKRGVLARPYFKTVGMKTNPKGLYRSTPWPKSYEVGVVNNLERNTAIVAEAARAVQYGLPVLILVTQRAHGGLLQSMLTDAGVTANYIFGDHSQDERQAALNALKDGRIQVLIGSTILDVGVDVPSMGMIVLAGAGKAEVALRQRIGRGLRAKKSGPNVALVVDFDDPYNTTLRDHARQRRGIVEMTPGFAENIVVSDFDYEGLGFVRKAA